LREALGSYEALLRADALEEYREDLLRHAVVSPYLDKKTAAKPPTLPEILRD
jgi:hypothetical protein